VTEKTKIPSRIVGVLLRPSGTFQEIAEHPDLIGALTVLLSFYLVHAIVYVVNSTSYFTLLGSYGVWIQLGTNRIILIRAITGGFLLVAGWALISLLLKGAYDFSSWKRIASPLGYAFMGGMLVAIVEALTIPFHPHFILPGPEEFDLYQQLMSNWPLITQWFLITMAFRILINLGVSILASYGLSAAEEKLSQPAMFLRIFLLLTAFSIIHLILFPPIEIRLAFATSD
jgi:hypothetical protein